MLTGTTNRADYIGNGAVSTYTFGFYCFTTAVVAALIETTAGALVTLVNGVDFTVALNADPTTGGSITITNPTYGPLPTGYLLSIQRILPEKQATSIRNQSNSYQATVEDALDQIVMIEQQLQDAISRSIRIPQVENPASFTTTLPSQVARANSLIGFDVNGNVIAVPTGGPFSGLTPNQVLVGGATGLISQSAGLTYDGSTFHVAATLFSQSKLANPQTYRIYNTTDSDTAPVNYERLLLGWSGNVAFALTQASGTGLARTLSLGTPNGTWSISGGNGGFSPGADNVQDVGVAATGRVRSIYFGTNIFAPNGTISAPAYTFASVVTAGLYYSTNIAGVGCPTFGAQVLYIANGGGINYLSGSLDGGTSEIALVRDAANVLAQKNGTNAQTFRIYGTTTGPHYVTLSHDSASGRIATTLTDNLVLGAGTTDRWYISGSNGGLQPVTDNTVALGTTSLRVTNYYASAGYNIILASGDANAVSNWGASGIQFGAGGATAPDVLMQRATNNIGFFNFQYSGVFSAGVTDFVMAKLNPIMTGAFTITRLNYIQCAQPGAGPTYTDAALAYFDAAIGTHKAIAANGSVAVTVTSLGPTGAQTTIQGWIKINVNGTLRYVPFF